jgi:hypothetical protein
MQFKLLSKSGEVLEEEIDTLEEAKFLQKKLSSRLKEPIELVFEYDESSELKKEQEYIDQWAKRINWRHL